MKEANQHQARCFARSMYGGQTIRKWPEDDQLSLLIAKDPTEANTSLTGSILLETRGRYLSKELSETQRFYVLFEGANESSLIPRSDGGKAALLELSLFGALQHPKCNYVSCAWA
jgi:hypothetical protein